MLSAARGAVHIHEQPSTPTNPNGVVSDAAAASSAAAADEGDDDDGSGGAAAAG